MEKERLRKEQEFYQREKKLAEREREFKRLEAQQNNNWEEKIEENREGLQNKGKRISKERDKETEEMALVIEVCRQTKMEAVILVL